MIKMISLIGTTLLCLTLATAAQAEPLQADPEDGSFQLAQKRKVPPMPKIKKSWVPMSPEMAAKTKKRWKKIEKQKNKPYEVEVVPDEVVMPKNAGAQTIVPTTTKAAAAASVAATAAAVATGTPAQTSQDDAAPAADTEPTAMVNDLQPDAMEDDYSMPEEVADPVYDAPTQPVIKTVEPVQAVMPEEYAVEDEENEFEDENSRNSTNWGGIGNVGGLGKVGSPNLSTLEE